MQSHLWRVFLLAMLAACASCSGGSKDQEADNTATAAETADPSSMETGTTAAESDNQLGVLVDLIVAEANELPRAEFDPAVLAGQLGKDPQAHFEWVRDNTWWAPYRGLLRGSKGVMLDRVGSNLDRAVLLGDLLRHAGYTVRLAHAEFGEGRARGLLGKVRPIPDQRRNPTTKKPLSPDRRRQIEAAVPEYAGSEQQRMAAARQFEGEARELVRSRADELEAAIRDMASGSEQAADRLTLAALQDHWWIERKSGGSWIAMDVLLPDSKPGDLLAAATSVSEWRADTSDPSIPSSDWHTVQIRVVVERYQDGATTESSVLETTLRPASVFDRPITLRHFPRQWPENLPGPETDPNALGNAAINVREWVPFLQVGGELKVQSGFTDSGNLIVDPQNSWRDVAGAGGAGFMTGFGETLGGGETAASSLTAEWIDYEIRVPGEAAQRFRRPVFDLLGPVLRSAKAESFDANTNELLITRSEALLSQTDIFLQPCELTIEYLSHLASASIVANQAAFRKLVAERDPVKVRDMAAALVDSLDVWGPLPDLASWRSALGEDPANWFVDRPNILNYRLIPAVVNADRETIKELIDIASNGIGVRQAAGRKSFQIRMRQGVADTVAELVALRGNLGGPENTASIISKATDANAGALVLVRDTTAVKDLSWPEDAAARLATNLEGGYAVVALRQPVELQGQARTGWWRIDPVSGETIGVMDTGFHQAVPDYVLTNIVDNSRFFHPSFVRAAVQEQFRREMQRATRIIVPILVAKLILGLLLVSM
jgi:hypothetical protein